MDWTSTESRNRAICLYQIADCSHLASKDQWTKGALDRRERSGGSHYITAVSTFQVRQNSLVETSLIGRTYWSYNLVHKYLRKCETQASFRYFQWRKKVLISSGKSNDEENSNLVNELGTKLLRTTGFIEIP